MNPIVHLDYNLDKDLLLKEAESAKMNATSYSDDRYPNVILDNWLISRHSSEYLLKIMDDFGVQGKPRFYWLQPYSEIPEHVDNGTMCSINLILSDKPAPIIISGKKFVYKQALLNTTIPHSVLNGPEERVMLKISIFDETFEELANRISYKAEP